MFFDILTQFGLPVAAAITMGLFIYIIFTKSNDYSRLFLIKFCVAQITGLFISHELRRIFVGHIRSQGYNSRSIYVVGTKILCNKVTSWIQSNSTLGYTLLGCMHVDSNEDLVILSDDLIIDELLIGTKALNSNQIEQLLLHAENRGIRIRILSEKLFNVAHKIDVDEIAGFPFLKYRKEPLQKMVNRIIKRSIDLSIAIIALVLFYSWFYLIMVLLIKFSSKGPVIFKQERIGKNGKKFHCLKFRTMKHSDINNKTITFKEDRRITIIGKLLRKTNLDELPQILNVLIGEMSIVGPRPHMLNEEVILDAKLDRYRVRRFVKPGITGWAAVNGFRGGTKDMTLMQKRIYLDIWYIENWSVLLDIQILWRTFYQMITFSTGAH